MGLSRGVHGTGQDRDTPVPCPVPKKARDEIFVMCPVPSCPEFVPSRWDRDGTGSGREIPEKNFEIFLLKISTCKKI